MTEADNRFEYWFKQRFPNVGDPDMESAFRRVARAAWDEGMKVASEATDRVSVRGHVASSQFADTSGGDRPDAPRASQLTRSTSQFDDTDGSDRPDSNRHHGSGSTRSSTDRDGRGVSQFSDGAIIPR